MMTIRVVCIGSLKEDYWRRACEEYQKRLKTFCKLEIRELNEYKLPSNPSDAQIQKAIEQEGKAILPCLTGYVAAMCIEGKQVPSESFADKVQSLAVSGVSDMTFVLGGSYGLSPHVKAKADFKLSMSEMTFPHQLARVMLLEQVYRIFQINSGGKYHK